MGTTADKLNLLLNSKADIKAALVEKGQTVSDVFSEYGDKIRAIQTGVELPALSNPASASEIGEGYEAINAAGERMVGTGELAVSLAPELTAQDTLIADIMAALEGKMVPSFKAICFSINGTYYPAEEGMTWAEWVESDYNTGGYYEEGTNIYHSAKAYVTYNGLLVVASESIVPNGAYTLSGGGSSD